jgi:hemolysin activation/secretion protein
MLRSTRHHALAASVALAALTAALPAVAQGVAPTFDIRAFQVKGNTVLSPDAVERAVYPFMGPGRTAADVESARAALQAAFESAGYIAVSVYTPEQSVEGGILQLEVSEQAIGQVVVQGARHPEAVRAKATSLTPGRTPNLPEFQRDVVALNQTASRQVTPELKAGEAPGTLDVVLTVEESSAFGGSVEVNNFHSAATTPYRVSTSLRHDDLWGRGDSLSVSAQIAPERIDDGTVFSANYLRRLGSGSQLLVYGVVSDSDIAVVGGTSVIGKGTMVGLRYIQSLGSREGFYHSATVGFDWKDFSEDVILGSDRASAPIEYFPIMASWRGDWSAEGRQSDVTVTTTFGLRGVGDQWRSFDAKRYNARPSFFALKLDAGHTEDLVHGLQINTRLTGQWSPDPLISNEGFSLGGSSSVRGYYESEALGDYGLAVQTELRSPRLFKAWPGVNEFRVHTFFDAGFVDLHDPLPGQNGDMLVSAGVGTRIRLLNHINGAVDVGAPLISGANSVSGTVFARFRLWGEF